MVAGKDAAIPIPAAPGTCPSHLPDRYIGVAGGSLFTAAQWVELQRQALIYNHMAASAPIPAYLLFSINSNAAAAAAPTSAAGAAYYYHGNAPQLVPDYGEYARYGHFQAARMSMLLQCMQQAVARRRCRRTDGKKWRCARDAEPDQKYCHRHLHRAARTRPPPTATAGRKPSAAAVVDAGSHRDQHKKTTQTNHAAIKSSNDDYSVGLSDLAAATTTTSNVRLPEQRENRLSLNYDTIAEHYHQLYCSGSASGVNKQQVVATATPSPTAMDDAIDQGASWVGGIGGPLGEVLGLGYAAD